MFIVIGHVFRFPGSWGGSFAQYKLPFTTRNDYFFYVILFQVINFSKEYFLIVFSEISGFAGSNLT